MIWGGFGSPFSLRQWRHNPCRFEPIRLRGPAGPNGQPVLASAFVESKGRLMRHRLYPLSDLEDIPGTTVFTAKRSRQAYHLHKFCMSLMDADNRAAFKADERAYLDRYRMSEEQKQAVLDRDFPKLIDLGGNIYFLVKLSNTDGWSAQRAVSSMTGMTPDEYADMMRAGGRSPEGLKSIRKQQQAEFGGES